MNTDDLRALADDIDDYISDLEINLEIWIEQAELKDKKIESLEVTIEALKSELIDILDERDKLQSEIDNLYMGSD